MTPSAIHVVLVDEHRVFVDLLAARINSEPDLHVVGTATDADEGFRTILLTKPDVAIMDIELPGQGALDTTSELAVRQKETRILFLTDYVSDVFIDQALRLNAGGYLMKSEPVDVLIKSIKRVAAGEACFSVEVEKRLEYDPLLKRHTFRANNCLSSLTSRQLDVLRHLAKGLTAKEVAKSMRLSEKSIDSHRYRIMKELGIHDRVQLARYAIREGLVSP